MACSGYREIKFLRKLFSFLIWKKKLFSSMRAEIVHIGSFTTKCNLEIIRGLPAVVVQNNYTIILLALQTAH